MARVAKNDVYEALDRVAQNIIGASGDDPIISRRDIRNRLMNLSGIEKTLTDFFYRFADHRDAERGARITKKDIDETLAYAKETLIAQYDVNNNGLSKAEIEQMSNIGKFAVQLAKELKEVEEEGKPTMAELLRMLDELSEDLLFDYFGSEAAFPYEAFAREANLETLNEETFSQVLGLDSSKDEEAIGRFETDLTDFYLDAIDFYVDFNDGAQASQMRSLIRYMEDNLTQIGVFVVGLDISSVESQRPVYWVGISPDGDLVGLQTYLVWT